MGRASEGKEIPWSQAQCFTFHDAPGVEPAPNSPPSGLYHSVAANYSKWDAFLQEVGGGLSIPPTLTCSFPPISLFSLLHSRKPGSSPTPYEEFYFPLLLQRNKMEKGCPGVVPPLGLGPVI